MHSPEQSLEFVRDHLGPTLRRDHPDLKLMLHDDQAAFLIPFLKTVLADEAVRQFVDGIAVHWYQVPTLNGGWIAQACDLLKALNMSDVFILATEACTGFSAILSPPKVRALALHCVCELLSLTQFSGCDEFFRRPARIWATGSAVRRTRSTFSMI